MARQTVVLAFCSSDRFYILYQDNYQIMFIKIIVVTMINYTYHFELWDLNYQTYYSRKRLILKFSS